VGNTGRCAGFIGDVATKIEEERHVKNPCSITMLQTRGAKKPEVINDFGLAGFTNRRE
jgi:hypothetical protein